MNTRVMDPGRQGAPAENWEVGLSRPRSLPWSLSSPNHGPDQPGQRGRCVRPGVEPRVGAGELHVGGEEGSVRCPQPRPGLSGPRRARLQPPVAPGCNPTGLPTPLLG